MIESNPFFSDKTIGALLMSTYGRCFLFALFLSAGALVCGTNVSVLMFETGIAEGDSKIEATSAWESGLMDEFFNSGYIVSNADTKRLDKQGLPLSTEGLAEARDGGAEYIIDIALDYAAVPAKEKTRISPRSVSYRMCDPRGKTLFQKEKIELTPTKSGSEDEKHAKEIARSLIAQLRKGR